MKQESKSQSRRHFVKNSTWMTAGITIGPQPFNILRKRNLADQISVAVMGVCSRGKALANAFAAAENCDVTYICEVDDRYVQDTLDGMAKHQEFKPSIEKDIRKVLEDSGVDAIVIAAPDHWHAIAGIMGCQAGKHVYVEKPCSHNPQEGEWLVQAARKYDRVVQMGNQYRSWSNIKQAIHELHQGIIGDVYYANAWYANARGSIGKGKKTTPPPELDFDLWQGPAPRRDYQDNLHPYHWHWFWHWGTGEALNNGTHFVDLARWGLQADYPTYVSSSGGRFHYQDDWETPDTQAISIEFANGTAMTWESRSCNTMRKHGQSAGVAFYGTGGSMILGSGNKYAVYDNSRTPKLFKRAEAENARELDQISLLGPGLSMDIVHVQNFLEAIRHGSKLNSEIEGGHKSVLLCQLGNIAYRTKSNLHLDAANGHILDNQNAQKLWSREYEPGWDPNI